MSYCWQMVSGCSLCVYRTVVSTPSFGWYIQFYVLPVSLMQPGKTLSSHYAVINLVCYFGSWPSPPGAAFCQHLIKQEYSRLKRYLCKGSFKHNNKVKLYKLQLKNKVQKFIWYSKLIYNINAIHTCNVKITHDGVCQWHWKQQFSEPPYYIGLLPFIAVSISLMFPLAVIGWQYCVLQWNYIATQSSCWQGSLRCIRT